jgi:branched-chain amino acid transport system permease protein
MWSIVGQQALNGLSLAAVYALITVGITLVFGLTRIVNFAHGDLMALGCYATYLVARGGGLSFVVGLLAAVVVVGAISLALERGLFRFTLSTPISGFIVSLGLILIIENGLVARFSDTPLSVQPAVNALWTVAGVTIWSERLLVIGVAVIVFGLLYLVLTRTRVGLALQGASVDREMVALLGIPVGRLIAGVFVLSGILAGVAGALISTVVPITPFIGAAVITKGFAIALVGGLGNVAGALLAAVIIGLLEATVAGLGFGQWIDGSAFAVMILVLLLRPRGIFGGSEAHVE